MVQDCETLLTIRDALEGDAELEWNADTPITEWEGVTVDGSPLRVTELDLPNQGLTGIIPPELGRLTALKSLILRDSWSRAAKNPNWLTGGIPAELGNLTALETMDLSGNLLTGPIPQELGNLAALKTLDLHTNLLSGPLPPELGGLTALERLYLEGNYLSGPISPELSTIARLQGFNLAGNYLTGCVSAELSKMWISASGLENCESDAGATR